MSMTSYNSSLFNLADGSVALCNEFQQYGGFYFRSSIKPISTFTVSKGIEFWVKTDDGSVPDMNFKLENEMEGPCRNDLTLADGKTDETDAGGWVKYYFPISAFGCTGSVTVSDLNRVRWESRRAGTKLCVKDVRLVPQDQAAAVAA
jgi:hypothetical protein